MSALELRVSHPRENMVGLYIYSSEADDKLWDRIYHVDKEILQPLKAFFDGVKFQEFEVVFQPIAQTPGIKMAVLNRPEYTKHVKVCPAGKVVGEELMIQVNGMLYAFCGFETFGSFIRRCTNKEFYHLFNTLSVLVMTAPELNLYPRIGGRPDWLTVEMSASRTPLPALTYIPEAPSPATSAPPPELIDLRRISKDGKHGGYTLPMLKKIAETIFLAHPKTKRPTLRNRNEYVSFLFQHDIIVSRLTMDQVMGVTPISQGSQLSPEMEEANKITMEDAIREGRVRLVRLRVAATKTSPGKNPPNLREWLVLAVKAGQPEIVKLLLDAGAKNYQACLSIAVLAGDLDIVEILCQYTHDYNPSILLCLEYLYHDPELIEKRRMCVIRLSMGSGINYNKALEIVAGLGDVRFVNWFISKGAKAYKRAMAAAVAGKHEEVIQILKEKLE